MIVAGSDRVIFLRRHVMMPVRKETRSQNDRVFYLQVKSKKMELSHLHILIFIVKAIELVMLIMGKKSHKMKR